MTTKEAIKLLMQLNYAIPILFGLGHPVLGYAASAIAAAAYGYALYVKIIK